MNLQRGLSAICVCLAVLAPSAFATVIDFESMTVLDCDAEPVNTKGYTFSSVGPHCTFGPGDLIENANNGSNFLIEGAHVSTLTNDAGQAFNLLSLDLGISFRNDVSPNVLEVTGLFVGGGSISQTLTLTNFFQTYTLTGFENLTAFTFSGLQVPGSLGELGYIAIDNLNLVERDGPANGEVPVPASLPLFALGLGVLAAARRRHKQAVSRRPAGS